VSEIRPAEWSLHAVTEREIVEGGRRRARSRRQMWALCLAAFGVCPLSCFGLSTSYPLVGMVGLVLPGGLLVYALVRGGADADRFRNERIRLQEEHAAVGGWIVHLSILQGAAVTGRDEGVVWFEDDRLLFAGRRTSFALSADGATGGVHESWSLTGSVVPLHAETVAGRVALAFEVLPWEGAAAPAGGGAPGFVRALRGWLDVAAPAEGGLPPLAVGPGAPAVDRLLLAAVANTAFWAAALGLFALSVAAGWQAAIPVALVCAVLLLGWSDLWVPRHRWYAWRDRRRLERAQWKR
jgi:hypothetical protein